MAGVRNQARQVRGSASRDDRKVGHHSGPLDRRSFVCASPARQANPTARPQQRVRLMLAATERLRTNWKRISAAPLLLAFRGHVPDEMGGSGLQFTGSYNANYPVATAVSTCTIINGNLHYAVH